MPSSTTLFSNSRSVQRARPFGGLEHAKAISLASFSPSKMRGTAGVARCLRLKTASNQQPSRRPLSLADQYLKLLTLVGAQSHNVLLYRILLPSHDCSPRPKWPGERIIKP